MENGVIVAFDSLGELHICSADNVPIQPVEDTSKFTSAALKVREMKDRRRVEEEKRRRERE